MAIYKGERIVKYTASDEMIMTLVLVIYDDSEGYDIVINNLRDRIELSFPTFLEAEMAFDAMAKALAFPQAPSDSRVGTERDTNTMEYND